ncbi:MAG: ATP-binding protein [Roseburia sp.]|nr:ATP-binding protein [Roseburia sp.]MCM1243931.1 ATP-binding protein [Roseburia sp.]
MTELIHEIYWQKRTVKKIDREIKAEELRLVLIYGRRRVGKSELVKTAIQRSGITSIYYECRQTTEQSNVESFCGVISETLNLPRFGDTGIEETLEYLCKLTFRKKMVVVLDEYPYLRENVKGLDSILQSLIDKYREKSKLTLIILGSYVEVMRSLIEHSNPLFGRADLVIDLKPMDYFESALFYPGFSDEDKVRIYSVFGGLPHYNKQVDDTKSVKENIIELIASPGARLENEVPMYLKGELSKIVNANETFAALARGYSRYSDILSQSHVSSGPTLIDILDKLMQMEVVKKTTPSMCL